MKTIYSNQKMIRRMQRENKLEELGKAFSKAIPFIIGTLAGIAIIAGMLHYSSRIIQPYVDKAAAQIEQKADYENRLDKFIYDSGAQRR